MKAPFFSIVIPVFNRGDFIICALESCLKQTFANFEIIVVDDGSTDHTAASIGSINDERVKYLFQLNSERGVARNNGVSRAKGQYIFFLDSDDFIKENHLERAYNYLYKSDFPELLFTGITFLNEKGKFLFKTENFKSEISKSVILKNNVCASAFFIRKDIAINNAFSEIRDLSGSEDRLLLTLLSCKYKLNYKGEYTYCLVVHDQRSMANESEYNWKNQLAHFLKIIRASNELTKNEIEVVQSSFKQMVAIKLLFSMNYKRGFVWYISSINSIKSVMNKNILRVIKFGVLNLFITTLGFEKLK